MLESGWPQSADEWQQDVGRLWHFVSFVTGQRALLTHLALRLPAEDGLRMPLVDVGSVQGSDVAAGWRPDRHFLPRNTIRDREAELLGNWWTLSRKMGIALDALVDATCRTTTYDADLFLRLAAGGEAYHVLTTPRNARDEDVMAAVATVRRTLRDSIDDRDVRKRVHEHLGGLSGIASYADRLSALVDRIGPARDIIGWTDDVTRQVTTLRNFLAHGMSRTKPATFENSLSFVNLIQRLQAVLRGNVLLDIGLSAEEMNDVLGKAYGPSGWYRLLG